MALENRYVRMRDGTVYGYTELLAARKDATVIDEFTAAQWFHSLGINNALTNRFPNASNIAPPKRAPVGPTQENANVRKAKEKEEHDAKMAIRDTKLAAMKAADEEAKDTKKPDHKAETSAKPKVEAPKDDENGS